MALSESVVLFVVSLLIGAFGVYVGGLVVAGTDDFGEALLVALLGALVWTAVASLLGDLPVVGRLLAPVAALVGYVAIVRWRFSVTWLRAGGVALLAWIIALGVLTAISSLGVSNLDPVGVPRWDTATTGPRPGP